MKQEQKNEKTSNKIKIYKHCMIKYEVKELFCMIETSPNMEKGYKEG